jgi:hypothetical protein
MAARVSFLLLAAGCSQVRSSAYVIGQPLPPSTAPVEVSATRDLPRAQELGVVEVHGRLPVATLERLVLEFRGRVAAMGGDYGRIDSFATRHEMVTETYDYECGTSESTVETQTVTSVGADGTPTVSTESVPVTRYVSKTCTGERRVEVATLTLVGRALRASGGNR